VTGGRKYAVRGLELSRLYYREVCVPLLEERFPRIRGRLAAGLAGEGSECLGFDDELSRDHDWGPGVCLWLPKRDFEAFGEEVHLALDGAPASFRGFPVRRAAGPGDGRVGVTAIEDFYYKFLGHPGVPESITAWMSIPEAYLCAATNGMVFEDALGEFTRIREELLAFYPEDVRLKKTAARCAVMAQAGRYNFPRCAARGESVAARMAESAFLQAACGVVFLLNRRYAPFYKWMHRALKDLPELGAEMFSLLNMLAEAGGIDARARARKTEVMEAIDARIAGKLREEGLSDEKGDFLLDHARAVQRRIGDATLRNMHVLVG
jgi:hypothetical protein